MRIYAYWLLADEADAAAIRAATTAGDPALTSWPHLALKQVDGPNVNKLERIVRPKTKGERSSTGGKLLALGKLTGTPFICVCRVEPAFLQSLAALDTEGLDRIAATWTQKLEDVEPAAIRELLAEMSAFARQAEETAKPVLQLDLL